MLFGAPIEFYLFGLTLLGVALLHKHALAVAVTGLAVILAYEGFITRFPTGRVSRRSARMRCTNG